MTRVETILQFCSRLISQGAIRVADPIFQLWRCAGAGALLHKERYKWFQQSRTPTSDATLVTLWPAKRGATREEQGSTKPGCSYLYGHCGNIDACGVSNPHRAHTLWSFVGSRVPCMDVFHGGGLAARALLRLTYN